MILKTTPTNPSCSADSSDSTCEEYAGLSRRGFLRGSLGVAGATAVASTVFQGGFREVAYAAAPAAHTLVVLSMRGGADGLSLVVPHGDPAYLAARPRIGVPAASLLAPDATFGLHPSLAPLLPLWQAGQVAAIQATGMAAPNRSHFEAMEIVEDADPGSAERRGWINRVVGLIGSGTAAQAVSLGTSVDPTQTYGPAAMLSANRLNNVRMPLTDSDATWAGKQAAVLDVLWANRTDPMAAGVERAQAAADEFAPAVKSPTAPANGAVYPSGDLGTILADTARLIRADIGAQVVTVDQGDWDMHSGLGNLDWGRMLRNADEFARCVAAFFVDLGALSQKVTVVTISEFGRRVAENANYGLDHGYGGVMFALGAGVRGGYYSRWPGLGAGSLVNGDLAVTTDYRSVLTEVLRSRTPVDATRVFPGFVASAPLGFMA